MIINLRPLHVHQIQDLHAGIVIAFPQRDVHLDVSGPLPIRLVRKGEEEQAVRPFGGESRHDVRERDHLARLRVGVRERLDDDGVGDECDLCPATQDAQRVQEDGCPAPSAAIASSASP